MSGWDEDGLWKWGRNGQRLTDAERAARLRARVARRNQAALQEAAAAPRRAAEEERVRRLYEAGLLSPARISVFLDAAGLHGPEVDIACGAQEPDVDCWEDGTLYPTWEQVLKLAKLVGCTPRMLILAPGDLHVEDTTLRFHLSPRQWREHQVKERFSAKAIRARLGEV